MDTHYTTRTAPARLAELGRTGHSGEPLTISAVRSLARAHDIGGKVGRDWLFTDADLMCMAALPGPGNPNWRKEKSSDDAPPPLIPRPCTEPPPYPTGGCGSL